MKPFSSSNDSLFDLETYMGRLRHFQKIINPLNLFYSRKTLMDYKEIIKNYSSQEYKGKYSDKELWDMKYVLVSCLHSDTGEPLPKLFSTAAMVPVNIPMVFGLAVLPPTPINQIFAQSLNQTYNFAFNYANRNASNSFAYSQLTAAYIGAVGSAVGISLGSAALAKKIKIKSLQTIVVNLSPFFGVAGANIFNLFFSRYKDFLGGIYVLDPITKKPIGEKKSFIAAKKAFWQTALTRVMIPIPVFIFPRIIISMCESRNMMPKGKGGKLAFNIGICAAAMWLGVSFAISVFPQYNYIHANLLEKEFQNMINSKGELITEFAYNKGL